MNRNNNPEDALIKDLLADRRSPLVERILENNQVIKHNFRAEQTRRENCHFVGCTQAFEFTLIPHQVIYPKYCEKHRSAFQRSQASECDPSSGNSTENS